MPKVPNRTEELLDHIWKPERRFREPDFCCVELRGAQNTGKTTMALGMIGYVTSKNKRFTADNTNFILTQDLTAALDNIDSRRYQIILLDDCFRFLTGRSSSSADRKKAIADYLEIRHKAGRLRLQVEPQDPSGKIIIFLTGQIPSAVDVAVRATTTFTIYKAYTPEFKKDIKDKLGDTPGAIDKLKSLTKRLSAGDDTAGGEGVFFSSFGEAGWVDGRKWYDYKDKVRWPKIERKTDPLSELKDKARVLVDEMGRGKKTPRIMWEISERFPDLIKARKTELVQLYQGLCSLLDEQDEEGGAADGTAGPKKLLTLPEADLQDVLVAFHRAGTLTSEHGHQLSDILEAVDPDRHVLKTHGEVNLFLTDHRAVLGALLRCMVRPYDPLPGEGRKAKLGTVEWFFCRKAWKLLHEGTAEEREEMRRALSKKDVQLHAAADPSNPLAPFIDQRCLCDDPEVKTPFADLWLEFQDFGPMLGVPPMGKKRFALLLGKLELESVKGNGGVRSRRGVRLRIPRNWVAAQEEEREEILEHIDELEEMFPSP